MRSTKPVAFNAAEVADIFSRIPGTYTSSDLEKEVRITYLDLKREKSSSGLPIAAQMTLIASFTTAYPALLELAQKEGYVTKEKQRYIVRTPERK